MSSTHDARVIRVGSIDPHPNADRLGIVKILGYRTCVRLGDFQPGDLAVFLEPDTVVSVDRPEFAFLADKAKRGSARIKAMRLRGEQSFGLLIRSPDGTVEGQDVWELLGLTHYEPPEHFAQGEDAHAPSVPHVKYDVESLRKIEKLIQDGDLVQITEKIHGVNGRFVVHEGVLHVGSHTRWRKAQVGSIWERVAETYDLATRLAAYPDVVFYGEVYGQVQDLKYGTQPGEICVAIFDAMWEGAWMAPGETVRICAAAGIPHVPILYEGPWSEACLSLIDGPSMVPGADHLREGIVVKLQTPEHDRMGRRQIGKLVSVDYLSRKDK